MATGWFWLVDQLSRDPAILEDVEATRRHINAVDEGLAPEDKQADTDLAARALQRLQASVGNAAVQKLVADAARRAAAARPASSAAVSVETAPVLAAPEARAAEPLQPEPEPQANPQRGTTTTRPVEQRPPSAAAEPIADQQSGIDPTELSVQPKTDVAQTTAADQATRDRRVVLLAIRRLLGRVRGGDEDADWTPLAQAYAAAAPGLQQQTLQWIVDSAARLDGKARSTLAKSLANARRKSGALELVKLLLSRLAHLASAPTPAEPAAPPPGDAPGGP